MNQYKNLVAITANSLSLYLQYLLQSFHRQNLTSEMEGLIRGLADAVLNPNHGRDRDNDDDNRDERSRSTWAEVSTRLSIC